MTKNKNQNQKAFTLIETIIYVVIFTTIVLAMVSFGSSIASSRMHNQMALEVNDQGSKVMKVISDAIQNASSINSPTISNSASNLSVATLSSLTNPTNFTVSNGILYITEGTNAPVALTNNKVVVSNLTFSNFSRPNTPDIIKISFNLKSNVPDTNRAGSYSFTFNGSTSLRK